MQDKLPSAPGVYIFRSKDGSVLYIGKAGNLRKRVASYFSKSPKNPKMASMISQIADVDFIQLKSEAEALLLEDRLVKEYQPRYNIELKDDKRYPLVKITVNEPWPRVQIVRLRKEDGSRYFGPYADAGALRRVLKFLHRTLNIRRCRPKIPGPKDKEHCLYYHLGECLAPCIKAVSPMEYQDVVKQAILLFEGRGDELLKKLRSKMFYMSKHKNYEKAAKIRDLIYDLESVIGGRVRKEILKGIFYNPAEIDKEVVALKEVLNLPVLPLWIDAFDVSNLFGKDAVGSLIVFRNGLPYKNGYRRFKIKTVTGISDYAMIKEIMTRRYKRLLEEKGKLPDLILIDGGKGQYNIAVGVLKELGLGNIKVVALAKSKDSLALNLLKRVRDEAHRFAISYHRRLRKL